MGYTHIRDPRGIFDTHALAGPGHTRRCPICSGLLDFLHGAAIEVDALVAGPPIAWTPPRGVRDTQPLPLRALEQIRDPDRTQPPLPELEVDDLSAAGFALVDVHDDADASGKIKAIERAKGIVWRA